MIRLALVGCGRVGRDVHLPVIARRRDLRVVAIADPDSAAAAAALRVMPAADVVDDWRRVVERDDVDAVLIASPPGTHASIALAVLARRRHVYIEKPMATTPEDARAVERAWRASGRVAMVGFNYRFNPRAVEARRRIAGGRIGEVTSVRCTFSTSNGPQAAWDRSSATGGGVLSELGSHHFDLVPYLTGRPFTRITSAAGDEDAMTIDAQLQGGAGVRLDVARRAGNVDRIEIDGTRGRLVLDRYRVAPWQLGYALARARSPWHEPSHSRALDAFVAAVTGKSDAIPTPADGRAVVDLVAAAASQARADHSGERLALHAHG